jgi:hypothetical protein
MRITVISEIYLLSCRCMANSKNLSKSLLGRLKDMYKTPVFKIKLDLFESMFTQNKRWVREIFKRI